MSAPHRPGRHRPKLGAMSVSLLGELLDTSLDPGYAAAAERRRTAQATGPPTRSARVRAAALTSAGLLLIGAVLGIGYRHTQRAAPESDDARQALVDDVERETTLTHDLADRAGQLGDDLADARDAALSETEAGEAATTRLHRLEHAAARTAVHGPGVRVTLGDAEPETRTDPVTGEQVVVPPDQNGRVLDRDLHSVVNALWSAGAETITVDGIRLTTTTPIRAAGEAILVDLVPVASPYVIEAIGDPDALLPRFVDTPSARRFTTYTSAYGMTFTVEAAEDLRMPAATALDPRYAETLPHNATSPPATGGGR